MIHAPHRRRARFAALVVAIVVAPAAVPAVAGAQPMDPYAPTGAKAKAKGKPAPAPAPAPVDPYAAPAAPSPAPSPARAQPEDPYAAPTPAAPAAAQPSDVDEAVAASLVARAHQLLDIKEWSDAKQLAVEALMRSPSGASSADAKAVIRAANRALGIADDDGAGPTAAPPRTTADATPPIDPYAQPTPTAPPRTEGPVRGRAVLASYGLVGGGLLGLAAVGAGGGESSGGADTGGALIGGLVGGGLGWWVGKHYDVSLAHARAVGAGTTWGAVAFGLFTDAVGGSDKPTTHDEVFVGSGVGALVGTFGAAVYADNHHDLTTGDVTLIDSLASIGLVGGVDVGELMQPYSTEAYSLNAALGVAGGVVVGMYAAPRVELSTRRLVRVDAAAAVGAGAPWLLYALVHSDSTHADERIFGVVSAAGMLTGAYLGLRWTRGMDDKKVAVRRRGRSIELGALDVRPATTPLAPTTGRGLIVDLARGAW
jgi:hypothetical protein